MIKKCLGCGITLQDSDEDLVGYIKSLDKNICLRCFKITNYGEYKPVSMDTKEFDVLLDEINSSNNLVVLVVDLFNFNPNIELFSKLRNDILLVLTKRDLLPRSIHDERLLNYIDNSNLNIVDRIIISSNKNKGFDELLDKINHYKKGKTVYICGMTNAGKSTMINKIVHNYSNNKSMVSVSSLPNTTLDKIEINVDNDLTLIDTPGIIDKGSIYYLLSLKELKKVVPKDSIRPITYQVREKQYFYIEDLLYLESSNNNITFYISNTLELKRYHKNIEVDLEKHEIDVKKNEDVVISGMGFIKFTKSEHITIHTLKDVLVYKRKSLI